MFKTRKWQFLFFPKTHMTFLNAESNYKQSSEIILEMKIHELYEFSGEWLVSPVEW